MSGSEYSLPSGSVLVGKFVIVGVLGRGGFGITYDGFDQKLRRRVAVKELFPDGAARHGSEVVGGSTFDLGHLRVRFIEEAQALARFDYAGIVRVLETFEDNGTAYMVMEYLEGENLEQCCSRLGRLSSSEVSSITLQLCAALERVHAAGILHRDVKPSNVILTPERGAVLIDFGSARELQMGTARLQTQMVSHGYAAPEQYSSAGRLGPATDMYALGATAWHAVVGSAPPSTMDRVAGVALADLRSTVPGISDSLRSFLEQALRMEATQRPANVADVRRIVNGESPRPAIVRDEVQASGGGGGPGATTIWSGPAPTKDGPPVPLGLSTKPPAVSVGGPNLPSATRSSMGSSDASKQRRNRTALIAGSVGVAAISLLAFLAVTGGRTNDTASSPLPSAPPATDGASTEVVFEPSPATVPITKAPAVPVTAQAPTVPPATTPASTKPPSTAPPSTAAPAADLHFLEVSSATPAETAAHRRAILFAIQEAATELAAARVTINVKEVDDAAIATESASALAVFSSGGSQAATSRVAAAQAAKRALIVVDGTSAALDGASFRTIASDAEQASAAAASAKTEGKTKALILSDASEESKVRAGAYRAAFPAANEIVLNGSNAAEAVSKWDADTAVLIAASDMGLVQPVLRRLSGGGRSVFGTDGMFDLAPSSSLVGARSFTSLAPVSENLAFSKRQAAAGLGSSDGQAALFAYESAKAAIAAIISGARTGEELSAALARVAPNPRVRVYSYTARGWK